jgi:hypothetical protein
MTPISSLLPPVPDTGPAPLPFPPPEPAHPVARFLGDLVHDTQELLHREPAKAVGVALAAGVLLNIMPTRFIVGSITAVAVTMLRPTLLTLGVIKAYELCTEKPRNTPQLSQIS